MTLPEAAATTIERLYSQHGEDGVILEAFTDTPSGFFVEVGCIDGRRFSNTLALEERGWRGICIEAHESYIDAIRQNRPRSTVVHCAIGDRDEDAVTFYANSRGSLSTLDPAMGEAFAARFPGFFHGFVEQQVPLRTISRALDDAQAPPVDVLSIDIEGCDVLAVRGLDLARHRPRLIVVEADSEDDARDIDSMLLPAGYHRGFSLSNNRFYFAEIERLKRVAGRTFTFELTHTAHPCDGGSDTVVRTVRRT